MEQLLLAATVLEDADPMGKALLPPWGHPHAMGIREHAAWLHSEKLSKCAPLGNMVAAAGRVLIATSAPPPRHAKPTIVKAQRAPRTSYPPYEQMVLQDAFLANPYPTPRERDALARRVGKESRQVQVFFQNARQRHGISKRSSAASPPAVGGA